MLLPMRWALARDGRAAIPFGSVLMPPATRALVNPSTCAHIAQAAGADGQEPPETHMMQVALDQSGRRLRVTPSHAAE
jgi:hypothetical protein